MPPLIPKAGLFRLKIDGMAHVFHAVEDVGNGSPPPAAGVGKIAVAPVPRAALRKVGGRAEDVFSFQNCDDLIGAFAVDGHTEDSPDDLGGFIVNDPLLRVIRVFLVAVERVNGGVLASHALGAFDSPDFLAGVSCEPLVHDVQKRGKIRFLLVFTVDSVINGDKADTLLREENFTDMDKTTKL